jgi:pyrroloquinoline quinone (PQQ) biosynthesis protein C
MSIRSLVESEYAAQTEAFAARDIFKSMRSGNTTARVYDDFIARLCRTHLNSPQILAFLYSLAPPRVAESLEHNLLEELGLDDDKGISHPELLLRLAQAAGFDESERAELRAQSQDELQRLCTDPILFGTLRELGLAVLLEVTCFEWMLSRLGKPLADLLAKHHRLSKDALLWFTHHSEVDQRHAEEGLEAVVEYSSYYELAEPDLRLIAELVFRENVFLKRYFNLSEISRPTLMLSL